ncbi:MAG TPA: response regulator [Kofleriaceae bacterium]|nr:response regulator [Kofleriaceae bacterium]
MNETILVVEDEALVAKDLQRSLIGLGYQVPASASSAEDALRSAELHHPDLVLMDIRIRGPDDGISAAAALRERFGVPVVYLTAYGDRATVERAKETAPYGYLLKPIKAEELRITVELALHKHAIDRELRARERWMATTLRSIGDGVIAIDPAGAVASLNRAAETLLGWSAAEALGRPVADVFRMVDPDTLAPVPGPLAALAEARGTAHLDGAVLARDGRPRMIGDSVAPIVDDGGQVLGAVLVFRDVEPERRLQQQVELSRRMAALGTLAAGVAHEINNPLAYIRTNVQVVREMLARHRDDGTDSAWIDDADEALSDADLGTEEVRRIVSDLRVFTAPVYGRRTSGEIRGALRWAIDVVGQQVRHHARFEVELGDTPPVDGDGGRLGQVFVNLLTNAAQAIERGGPDDNQVSLRSWTEPDGWAAIEVADTGCGIAESQLTRIFDPFYSARKSGRGTGLGLAICHGIVTSMGGRIEVWSQLGGGSRFRVRLPPAAREAGSEAAVAPASPRVAASAAVQAAAGGTARLLVVEDDPLVRNAIARTLGDRFDLVMTEGARAALARLDAGERFPLILCDLTMPGMSGIELFRQVDARLPDQARRMLFITGGAVNEEAARFLAEAPLGHVEKPFDREALITRLGLLLDVVGPPEA